MIVKVVGREKPELRLIFEGTCIDAKSLAQMALHHGRDKNILFSHFLFQEMHILLTESDVLK
jgi:hypothetical protein